jgi:hypothetical protein
LDTTEPIRTFLDATREAALQYLAMGWSIIPVGIDTKTPCIQWAQYQERRPTQEEVEGWFDRGVPDGKGGLTTIFNIGIVTGAISNLVVLDCDNDEAVAYAVTDADAWSVVGVKTSRGRHFYFAHPGGRVQNAVGGTAHNWPAVSGLDLRGDGGYVVAPPSVKFGSTGSLAHAYSWTFDKSELETLVSDLQKWPGISVSTVSDTTEEFSFEKLSLSGVRTYGERAWDQAKKRVDALGRLMQDGDGRNNWLTRYVGECVAQEMTVDEVAAAVELFEKEFPPLEKERTVKSIVDAHRRNHPAVAEVEAKQPKLRVITADTLPLLMAQARGPRFLIDPYIAPASITQVVGFNGSGKTHWLMGLLWAAAAGNDYGSATVHEPVRVLYLDYELPIGTVAGRMNEYKATVGPMPKRLTVWSASASSLGIDFSKPSGIQVVQDLLNEFKPQIVVIDTVRSAWPGMDEKSPGAWVRVNQFSKVIRHLGISVVLVHHRNKPGQMGMGREAGSTAQLTDIDTQIIITKVVEDAHQAQREAALVDATTKVVDASGKTRTAFGYLRAICPLGHAVKFVFEVSFGKLRQSTENHTTTFFGISEHKQTGERWVLASPSPRQKAVLLRDKMSMTSDAISARLGIPEPTISHWLEEKKREGGRLAAVGFEPRQGATQTQSGHTSPLAKP